MSILLRQMVPIRHQQPGELTNSLAFVRVLPIATLEATVSPVKLHTIYTCDTKVDLREKRIEENWIYELQNSRED